MSEQMELALTSEEVVPPREPGRMWHLVTNQLNLMFMLAGGLITGPKGFGKKYYCDPLSFAPGWIPLFGERIPGGALDQSTSEGSHLRSVAAVIDLSSLRGAVRVLDGSGQLKELNWPDEANGDEQILFVPAPLPIGWLQAVLLPSKEALAEFRAQAADYANVSLDTAKPQVKAKLFTADTSFTWPLREAVLAERDEAPHRASAVGAVQALLVGLGNRGLTLCEAARLLADSTDGYLRPNEDPWLCAVVRWASRCSESEDEEVQTRILTRLLDAIVGAKHRADAVPETSCPPDSYQVVLEALEEESRGLNEPKWQEALIRLINDLRGLLGLSDDTISEILKRHARPFSRGLILFFLRPRCDELLSLYQPLLTEQDLVVAAALFGARSGWIGLPQALKDMPGLTAAATHHMAVKVHQEQGSGVELGSAPPRVWPLLELLQAEEGSWSKRQREGALRLARGMGWQEVLKTRISLGKGEYRLQVDGRGVHLLLDGDVKAVVTEADPAIFFEFLAKTPVSSKVEADVRSGLQP